jgi:hypothetical protein
VLRRRDSAAVDPARDINASGRKLATRTAFIGSIRILISRTNVQRASTFICLRPKTKPAQNFQMRGKRNFQMRRKILLQQGHSSNKISMLDLAGAGGIEPPNGGIKIRCLTTWLRPNRMTNGTGRKYWLPQIPVGRSRSIGSEAAFQPPGGAKYHSRRLRTCHTLL